jgi:rhodanese-related sulfurtransferase/polyisoprenoid-binding protein YceI
MKYAEIKAIDLKKMFDNKEEFLMIDVSNPEYFSEKHIIGATNAPVYEVAFLEHIGKITEDKKNKIVVYGAGENSLDFEDAAMKLEKAGFENVIVFKGGISDWEEKKFELEKGAVLNLPKIKDGKYELDKEKSVIHWSGRNGKYRHIGNIAVKEGELEIKDGKLKKGKIVLDMNNLINTDLTDQTWNSVLISHLKSSDFFDVEKFPQASFEITGSDFLQNSKVGTSNYVLKGDLNIKGNSNSVEFPAMIVPMEDGEINGQAHFDFDRTLWNVRYGSEKFFRKLGMHLVNDVVSLDMFLVAKKLN